MPSSMKGSNSRSACPAQPIHAPSFAFITGSRAVTSPPGECCHEAEPSSAMTRSTGRRLETTTNP
jgi:hypothetical protein